MNIKELAYKLALKHGYKYTRSNEYTLLSYSNQLKIGNYVRFILEQEN